MQEELLYFYEAIQVMKDYMHCKEAQDHFSSHLKVYCHIFPSLNKFYP